MKRLLPHIALSYLVMLASCVTRTKLDDYGFPHKNSWISPALTLRRPIDHVKDPWNPVGAWRRVAEKPPSYVPTDFPSGLPLNQAQGVWHVDGVDGWRFFVPHKGTNRFSKGVLDGDVKKITNLSGEFRTNNYFAMFTWPFRIACSVFRLPIVTG